MVYCLLPLSSSRRARHIIIRLLFMQNRESKGEGHEMSFEKTSAASDADELIAQAEAAASEAQRAVEAQLAQAKATEIRTTTAKKKEREESAQRTEQLHQFFAGLRAEDAFVEDYAFEWVFEAGEAVACVARPEKINETVGALRKTGEALRRFAGIEQMSDVLVKKMEQLRKLHDVLFEQVQTAVVQTLEIVKKKYKGEETEFEARCKFLSEGPLVRGIEQGHDTPEAREAAIKHEISELLWRPVVDGLLKRIEHHITQGRSDLIEIQSRYEKVDWDKSSEQEMETFADSISIERGVERKRFDRRNVWIFKNFVSNCINEREKRIRKEEPLLEHCKLAFEMNSGIVEEILKDEHDQVALQQAFTELQELLRKGQKGIRERYHGWREELYGVEIKSLLAQKILDRLRRYSVSMENTSNWTRGVFDLSIFIQMMLTSDPFIDVQKYDETARAITDVVYRACLQPGDPAEHFVEDGRFINMRRAYQKSEAGLSGRKIPKLDELPEELTKKGWKVSKLGAFVEPGQDVRVAEREYTKDIERFSQLQVDTENVFDVRDQDGGFRVYTLGQAMDLLRRARRDAMAMIRETAQAQEVSAKGKEAGEAERKRLERSIEGLNRELDVLKKASQARENALTGKLGSTEEKVGAARDDLRRSEAVNEEKLAGIRNALKGVLGKKAGMFSGDREFRQAVLEIMEQIQ